MRMQTKVVADIDSLQFGYWDMETEEFIPINAEYADELKKAAAKLGCTEELLDALTIFAASIVEVVGSDLRSIWTRLNDMQKTT